MEKYKKLSRKISHEDYLNLESLGSSTIKTYSYAPYAINENKKQTSSMSIGTMFHSYLLEIDEFKKQYHVGSFNDKRKSETKEEISNCKEMGKKWISPKEFQMLLMMRDAVNKSDYSKKLLENGIAETSFEFEIDGVKCKCRPDWVTNINGSYICVDLKTMSSKSGGILTVKDIETTIANFKYHIQAAFYKMGMQQLLGTDNVDFVNIFVQTPATIDSDIHCVACSMPDETLDIGEIEIRNAIDNIKKYKIIPTAEGFISETQFMNELVERKGIPLIGLPAWYRS